MRQVGPLRLSVVLPALGLSGALGLAGCSRQAAPPEDPAFEARFAGLAAAPITVGEEATGEALMGSVRRVSKPETSRPGPSTEPPGGGSTEAPLPPSPSGEAVAQVLRTNAAAMRGCHVALTRSGVQRSGKAIVTFAIDAAGRPREVKVDAPAFSGTSLPGCIAAQIARWSFPPSQQGAGASSYPFVFVAN